VEELDLASLGHVLIHLTEGILGTLYGLDQLCAGGKACHGRIPIGSARVHSCARVGSFFVRCGGGHARRWHPCRLRSPVSRGCGGHRPLSGGACRGAFEWKHNQLEIAVLVVKGASQPWHCSTPALKLQQNQAT
jgi:hypothetical protein